MIRSYKFCLFDFYFIYYADFFYTVQAAINHMDPSEPRSNAKCQEMLAKPEIKLNKIRRN